MQLQEDADVGEMPTQVMLCEFVRFLELKLRAGMNGRKPRVAVVVTAWDLLDAERGAVAPRAYLEREYPLFAGRLDDVSRFEIGIFSMSILGGDPGADKGFRARLLDEGLESAGYVQVLQWQRDTRKCRCRASDRLGDTRGRNALTAVGLHRQLHGYRSGHQLLHSTARIQRKDQDRIDQLSDMAGPLRPGETFDPYVSAYPLPSSEYYVLARTEQDHAAPRAGCVITNSLLVPRTYWERDANPASLMDLLEGPVEEDAVPAPANGRDRGLEAVKSPMLAELVESLFLRERGPVVVFDAPNPVLIALRLLTAFWPAMRREFSLCTFALSPRTVGGKSFDLVFAPETVRSRFSDWEGWRIGSAARTGRDHHRWAEQIQASVFQKEKPTLLPSGHLRALGGHENDEDEAFFRLLMLWGELQEKAARSPMAVLGLIDIAKSRRAMIGRLLESEICNAMDIATREMKASDAWSFLGTLMEKLSGKPLSQEVCRTLRSVVGILVRREWKSALEFLVEHVEVPGTGSGRLTKEVAGSLAAERVSELKGCLALVPADALIQVLLLDDDLLALALAGESDDDVNPVVEGIEEGWRGLSRQDRAANEMRLLAHVQGEHQIGLVAEILGEMKAERLSAAVGLIWNERGMRDARLGDAFCDAALAKGVGEEVRTVFADADGDENTDRCIARLLKPIGKDMKWVLENPQLRERRTRLLGLFVEDASQEDLEAAFGTQDVAGGALDMFVRDVDKYSTAAARIVVLPSLTRGEQVERGLKLYDHLEPPERGMVGQRIASGMLAGAGERNTREIEDVLGVILPHIDMLKVVDEAFAVDRDGATVSALLENIEEFTVQTRSSLERNAGRIVESIASRDEFDLTANGAASLANLIERARSRETNTHVQMCCKILPLAMSARDKPASPVILASFPTVHNGLEGEREFFGLLHLFMLAEWNKARTLRKELVRAYMNSNWPPEDLAVAGIKAKALGRILKRVVKEPGGRGFLKQIEKGGKRSKEGCPNRDREESEGGAKDKGSCL